MAKILFVEDDTDLAGGVIAHLKTEKHVVEHCVDGESAIASLAVYNYDLLILDFMLPDINGDKLCRRFREEKVDAPILMLTGQTSIENKERGLDAGADDYLTKPFDLRELSARIRALLRRPALAATNLLTTKDLTLDAACARVIRAGKEIRLQAREFALLEFLLRHKGHVYSAEDLLDRVWTSDSESSPEAVRQTIKRLRDKIDIAGEKSLISTIVNIGYSIEN